MTNEPRIDIRPKEREQLFQALRAGVVPRAGMRHIQVGRAREIQEIARDMDRIAMGSTSFRIVVGAYGAGKTYFLNLTRAVAWEKKLVTVSADLSPEKRLHSGNGQARALLAELTRSMATRAKPEGGALEAILQRLLMTAREQASETGTDLGKVLEAKLLPILDLAGGYDAVAAIRHYASSDESEAGEGKEAALKWLRAEFSTKTEARAALPVREIPDDTKFWDHLKVLSGIVRAAGYDGLLVLLDEVVNLYKIPHAQARTSNYEEILRILNDLLQGSIEGIGLMLGATPELLMDTRRGLHSYEALRSRLAENQFGANGLVDLSGPVLRLQNLSPEDVYVLLGKLRATYLSDAAISIEVPDEAIIAFMDHCKKRIGAAYFQTPRATIRAFVDMLEILRQNPDARWSQIIQTIQISKDPEAALEAEAPAVSETDEPAPRPAPAPAATDQAGLPIATPSSPATSTEAPKTEIRNDADSDLASFTL
jgi:hypothetical protein